MDTNEKGRTEAFIERLYLENYRKMMSMVSKDLVCFPVTEDIVQDTFYEAIKNINKLWDHENPGGWLMNTAKLKMMAYKKRMNIRSLYEINDVEWEMSKFENEYGLIEINTILDLALDPHEKMLFLMFYVQGYSAREMAELEGISEGNFRVRMLRIRNKVQKLLEDKKKHGGAEK